VFISWCDDATLLEIIESSCIAYDYDD
jgi:hypothetical protein